MTRKVEFDSMIRVLVEHDIQANTHLLRWRNDLVNRGIYRQQEVAELSDKEIAMLQRALLFSDYARLSIGELVDTLNERGVTYKIEIDQDYTAGAVAYS